MAYFEIAAAMERGKEKSQDYNAIVGHEVHRKKTGRGDVVVLLVEWGDEDENDTENTITDENGAATAYQRSGIEQMKIDDPDAVMEYFLGLDTQREVGGGAKGGQGPVGRGEKTS